MTRIASMGLQQSMIDSIMQSQGKLSTLQDQLATPQHIARIAGLEAYHALEARYGPAGDAAALE